ncbi:MAG: glycosyltransferase family 2 protein [Caulobacterales bacterium]
MDNISSGAAVTIIVVAHNSARYRARQMAALAAQTIQIWRLIYVDNSSRPIERPSQSELMEGAVLIQNEENLGFAAANNRAAETVRTEFIAFLNPDAFPEPDWLEQLLAGARRHPNAAAFASLQLMDAADDKFDGAGDVMHASGLYYRALHGKTANGVALSEGGVFSACAAAALYRTQWFHKLGGFDEDFFCYGEDVDLGFRLRLAGGATILIPAARVQHVGGGASEFADYYGARNRVWVFLKNMPLALLIALSLPFISSNLILIAAHGRNGRRRTQWSGFRDGCKSAHAMIAKRNAIHRNRAISTLKLAAMLTWSPQALVNCRGKILDR